MFLIEDIIDLAIQIEHNAERVYRKAQKEIANPSLSSMLEWLADKEVEHAERFFRLKKQLNTTIKDPTMEEMGRALLSDVLGSQSFSLKDANFSEISRIEQLLSLVIEFEKDKVMFYELLRPFVEEKTTLDFIESIIKEEDDHIQRLQTFSDSKTQKMQSCLKVCNAH